MKFLVLLVAVFAIAQGTRDWSKIRVREITRDVRGRPTWGSRIVGGHEARPHQFPYQCALFIDTAEGQFFCGGTLIDQKYVLTAAHCVEKATSVEVVLGAHNIREEEATQVKITVPEENINVHEDWDSVNIVNDIALLQLSEEAPVNDEIETLPLNEDIVGEDLEGELAIVNGWGKPTDLSTEISPVLRTVNVSIISHDDCNVFYGTIKEEHLCVDSSQGEGPCNGDSGGPLTIDFNDVISQVGIVSFGSPLGCEWGYPGVFTRLSLYIDWVNGKMN